MNNNPISPTFSARVAADIVAFAAEQGADGAALIDLLGLEPGHLNREDVRIPCVAMARMWEAAIEQTGDALLGLHLAEARNLAANRTTSLIMESSATVREAFDLAAKYSVLIADVMAVEIGEQNDTIYIEFTPHSQWAQQSPLVVLDCLNITYLSAVHSVQRLTGSLHPPTLLTFTLPKPANLSEYFRVFDCSVKFEARCNRIGFPKALRDARVATSDVGLKELLKRYAEDLKSRFQPGGSVVNDVVREILSRMSPFPPTLSTVAKALGMSDRTLQRQLKLAGETYKGLVERARMELSEKYLLNSNQSVDEIAYLSGYSDTSSFVRAFRRWHGETPRQFAKHRRASSAN